MYYLQSSLAFKTVVSAQNEETTSNKNDRRSEDQIEFARGRCKMHAVQERPSFYGYYFDNFICLVIRRISLVGKFILTSLMLLIQALGDIQIAIKALHEEEESLEHPIDKHYKTLNCSLTPLDHESDDFKVRFSFYFSLPLICFVSDPLPKSIEFDWLSLLCTAVWMSQGGSYTKSNGHELVTVFSTVHQF